MSVRAARAGPWRPGVLVGALDLDLHHIDLSPLVGRYIGETEKSLQRILDAAREVGAVLLFDDVDPPIGERTEAKDAHDRCANIEVS